MSTQPFTVMNFFSNQKVFLNVQRYSARNSQRHPNSLNFVPIKSLASASFSQKNLCDQHDQMLDIIGIRMASDPHHLDPPLTLEGITNLERRSKLGFRELIG